MNFKEWCQQVLGIHSFAEGKIINQIFLPLKKGTFVLDPLLTQCRCYPVNMEGSHGLLLTKDSYSWLISHLRYSYQLASPSPIDEAKFKEWVDNYFSGLGINHQRKQDYNALPSIHVVLRDQQHHAQFVSAFSQYYPLPGQDVGTQYTSVQMMPGFIGELYSRYYADSRATIRSTTDVSVLEQHQTEIEDEIEIIAKSETERMALNKAHRLSLDYDNTDLSLEEASSSYATSLRVYAKLNKDNLSQGQYVRLMYAANVLESANEGILTRGLTRDIRWLKAVKEYYEYAVGRQLKKIADRPILKELGEDGKWVLKRINDLAHESLYGSPGSLNSSRFLPDNKMQSDTDVIIVQGGGRIDHSAIYRIIKVGVLADGQRAQLGQTPHHYEYFKVENNLGAGCHEVDFLTKTCTGTYVTMLSPFHVDANEIATPANINPYTHPAEYEKQMSITIQALMATERQLLLYRAPQKGPNDEDAAPAGSQEAAEWTRLNNLKKQLSGQRYPYQLDYFGHDPLEPAKKFLCTVMNQRSYIQGGGSCPIFSIKSLVSSITGPELSALHIDYLQRHDAQGHLVSLQNRKQDLAKHIKSQRLTKLSASIDSLSSLRAALNELEADEWKLLVDANSDVILAMLNNEDTVTIFIDKLKLSKKHQEVFLSILREAYSGSSKFDSIDRAQAILFFKQSRTNYYDFFNYLAEKCDLPSIDSSSQPAEITAIWRRVKKECKDNPTEGNQEILRVLPMVYKVLSNPVTRIGYHRAMDAIEEEVVAEYAEYSSLSWKNLQQMFSSWASYIAEDKPHQAFWQRFFAMTQGYFFERIGEMGLAEFMRKSQLSTAHQRTFVAELGGAYAMLEKIPNSAKLLKSPFFAQLLLDSMQSPAGKLRMFQDFPPDLLNGDLNVKRVAHELVLVANLKNLAVHYESSALPVASRLIAILNRKVDDPFVDYKAMLRDIDILIKATRKEFIKGESKGLLTTLENLLASYSMSPDNTLFKSESKSQSSTLDVGDKKPKPPASKH